MDLYFLGEHISSMAKVTRFSKKIKFSLEIKILTVTLADNFKFHESNRQQATSIRLCLIAFISLFYSSSFGQSGIPPGSTYWIENCYQKGAITILEMVYPFTLCCSCDIRQNDIPND